MSDPLDIASAQEKRMRDAALDRRRQLGGLSGKTAADSALYCENDDCGVPIPQARRMASPGCRHCIECQNRIERGALATSGRRLA